MRPTLPLLQSRLADARSRRVVFLSHCLLNQNVRYLGGASHAGIVPSAIERFVREGVGLVQMPCPEQVAWGGVLKRRLLLAYGAKATPLVRLREVIFPIFLAYTRTVYRRIARDVAAQVADYVRSGVEVVGIVGVGDSPSCGVHHTLDVRRALPVVVALDFDTVDRATFVERVVRDCLVEGRGMFVEALQHELDRRALKVPFFEHDPFAPQER